MAFKLPFKLPTFDRRDGASSKAATQAGGGRRPGRTAAAGAACP